MARHAATAEPAFPKRRDLRARDAHRAEDSGSVPAVPLPELEVPSPLRVTPLVSHAAAILAPESADPAAGAPAARPSVGTRPSTTTAATSAPESRTPQTPHTRPTPVAAAPVRTASVTSAPAEPPQPLPQVEPVVEALPTRPIDLFPAPSQRTISPRGVFLPPVSPLLQGTTPVSAASCGATPPAPRTSRLKRAVGFTGAALAAGALGLTMALPGVQLLGDDSATGTAAHAQLLDPVDGGEAGGSFEALNSVRAEIGDTPGTFWNYTDAEVQYPFAQTVPLSDPFGERLWPVAGMHDAQDFAAPDGTPIQAIARGTVTEAGFASDGCGFGLKLEHDIDGQKVTSRYCHMQNNSHSYTVGDVLEVGDPVGRVGNTGLSFGAHLHFALTVNGQAVDPMPFLLKYNRESRPQR